MPDKKNFKIILVGVEFEENLSLRYLAGSLLAAGYPSVTIQPYNSLLEAEAIADSIIDSSADLVGISMAFQVRAIEDMTLVQLLKEQGYRGHITAGGQFATLHYSEIFHDCTGLDSVLRFEAEATLVTLADTLLSTGDLQQVPSLIWKDEHGTVQVNNNTISPGDIDLLPWPMRKKERAEYLGLKTMHMVGSRGCHATCKYCCVAALATERSKASKEAGGTTALPGTRRRTAGSVAREIARLYFEQDIRIFEFQDDNWIHPKVSSAVEYFTELKEQLAVLGVGQIGLSLKTRADSVQHEIIKVLKEIGLIRVFVGIESGTQSLLSKLGRKSRENVSLQALKILREFRIPAYFNALLFGPDIRFEDLEPELEFLEQCTDFPFEIVEVVIYGKTGLYLSLKMEKRLLGNYLNYDYRYLDAETQATHYLIGQLETRHFGVYSPVKMAADLGFNLGILQVFYPGATTDQFAEKVTALTRKINEDQVRVIRKAAAFAKLNGDLKKTEKELVAEAVAADLGFYEEIIRLQLEIEAHVKAQFPAKEITAYYRTGAVVQSALIASIFMLTLNSAEAQEWDAQSTQIVSRLVELTIKYDRSKWKEIEDELQNYPQSVGEIHWKYLRLNYRDFPDQRALSTKEADKNKKRISRSLSKLSDKRRKEDYKRLMDIIQEHKPKIKIATSLIYILDKEGKVKDIKFNQKNRHRTVSSRTKGIIKKLLKAREFHAYEATGSIAKPPIIKKPHIRIGNPFRSIKYLFAKPRRGPMD